MCAKINCRKGQLSLAPAAAIFRSSRILSRKMAKSWAFDAKRLLSYVPDDELFQLASTVCKDRLQFASKNEAVEAIIAACEFPDELLRKRKVKRDYLLRYIWEYGRSVDAAASLPIKGDKRQLAREVLSIWRCGGNNALPDDDFEEDASSDAPSSSNMDSTLLTEFASRFLEWFYNVLNNCAREDNFHGNFYGNCLLRLRCGSTNESSVNVETEGGPNVSKWLRDFVVNERLAFQPNMRPPTGFQALQESHGAILVKSNGTVHRRSVNDNSQPYVLGPYEQMFLVIEDPHTKSWKIQQTALFIKAEITMTNTAIDYR